MFSPKNNKTGEHRQLSFVPASGIVRCVEMKDGTTMEMGSYSPENINTKGISLNQCDQTALVADCRELLQFYSKEPGFY